MSPPRLTSRCALTGYDLGRSAGAAHAHDQERARAWPDLARYARPSADALARMQAQQDPARRR